MTPPEAFYVRDGDYLVATPRTRGPWSEHHQHGGPPAALLVRAIEHAAAAPATADTSAPGFQIVRACVELLRPVPIAAFTTSAEIVRDGRKTRLARASLLHDGAEVARASALLIRRASLRLPALPPEAPGPPPPDRSAAFTFPFMSGPVGYHTSVDWKMARGRFGREPTCAWLRPRHALVDGEPLSPWQRVMIAADSGNGVSMVADPTRWLFINPDLTVHLSREPAGEWIALDAETTLRDAGVGLTDTRLFDERGPIGRAVQSLLVDAR